MPRFECWLVFGLICFLWVGGAQAGPKNIILMIGDGMGPEQVQSGRLLDPDGVLALDEMDPNPGLVNTRNVFGEITDSAAGATALATGFKTANGNVSMDVDDVTELPTSMEAAQAEGMATGLISSVYMCDATPGVWVAHAPSRSCSMIIPQQIEACVDVFLGSGKTEYVSFAKPDNYINDLVDACDYQLVKNAKQLKSADPENGRLLGMWGGYTLTYTIDRQNDPDPNLPTLAEMTAKAIEVLSRDPDGFFLMVEGGAIDWMAHNKDIAGTARDMVAFDEAIAVAYNFAKTDGDTLVVVTADHETGGLKLGDSPNVAFIESITASTDFMWGLVHRDGMSVEGVLDEYAGVDDLTQAEKQAIADYGEMAISDALSVRANVVWGATGIPAIAPDEGDHTDTEVEVFAFGPGSEPLEGHIDNTDIGKLLFDAVNGN